MKKGTIYALRCPLSGDIRYVGQTIKSVNRRLTEHKCDKRHNPYKINWINKLDNLGILDELKIEVLEECDEILLNDREKFWIEKIKQDGNKLVNLTDGGDGVPGKVCSDETKKKISESNKGKIISDKSRKKISNSHKGKKLSEEHKKSISDGLILAIKEGRKIDIISEEQKIKISEGLKKYFLENPRIKKEKIKKEKKIHIYTNEEKLKMSKKMLGSNNPFYGKTHSEETKKIIGEKNKKMIGEKNPFYGKTHSEKTKEKIANTLKEKPKKIYYIYDNNNIFIKSGTSLNLLSFFEVKTTNNISRYCDKNKLYKGYYIKSN